MKPNWYGLSVDEALDTLNASHERGLSRTEVEARRPEAGWNELAFKKTPAWVRFLRQFKDSMVVILLVTAAITGLLTALGSHMLPDTLVILGVVLLNAILGFVQEGKAEGALDALRSLMVPECLVMRDGELQRLPSRELVPGDLVILEGGDKIPADIRFIDTSSAYVDESSLTGESVPVQKSTQPIAGDNLVPGDQRNMGFSGTYLTQGTARGLVVETGANTVFGRIADMVKSADAGQTPLQRKMSEFVHTLIKAILAVGAFNFVYGLYLGYDLGYSFLGAVSLVVAAIPEMLPALVTAILAVSGTLMAARKALIRKLPAAETLGATSVICSDKTGTLTENRMTVTRVQSGAQTLEVTGVGYDVSGHYARDGERLDAEGHPALRALLEVGAVCNNAHLKDEGGGVGDPTELALLVSAAKAGITKADAHRLAEIPFDSATKYMAVLTEHGGRRFIAVKGAPETVLGLCATQLDADGRTVSLDAASYLSAAQGFARQALRTLGFAFKEVDADHVDLLHADLSGLTFAGLQGMIDPPKPSAIEAVAKCKSAGIRTVMVTGDHPDTAQAVAAQLGITADQVITGAQLAEMSPESLRECVKAVSVFARVAPEHKKSIAEAFQANGLVVAMTGDGVNDAPALKQADIGVAMGIAGTEVAREAADMVLADDNFATIVNAVEEGRHAWTNLQKAILYTLPTNAAQALLIMGAIFMAAFVPVFAERFVLEPIQILWINLIDSVLLTLPLMMEPKEKDLLSRPPRDPGVRVIDALFLQRVVLMGLMIAVPSFLIYHHFGAAAVVEGELVDPLLLTQAQTAAFWVILMTQIGYLISARSLFDSAFRLDPLGNPWLLGGIGLSVLLHLMGTFVTPVADAFRLAAFPIEWWPLILATLLPSFLAIETDKLIRARLARR
ncbi:cation-translocating P-type ATPase [Allochromatium vinosum]|uniref:ATPase, P-type (Transporting), HAD superfamily, subfamily IC n=1 Tax=Allochromatium vinosum (strain ATCC 17899 / DSM 180 / NBRC 103801 / NCIMB 10441 / D) TaxID=572477 RepID=D3RNI5_ALLVD|nr:HAD-IC family P-type ATPase [Allochromatium vinosum]ADC63350.1 ATPase, P-type (transporting), HAD superfamily, subfamily IC [Allochromatium vinosum DSM 180]